MFSCSVGRMQTTLENDLLAIALTEMELAIVFLL